LNEDVGSNFPPKPNNLNMKHYSLLAGLALCTTAIWAQRPSDVPQTTIPQPVSAEEAAAARAMGVEALNNPIQLFYNVVEKLKIRSAISVILNTE